MESTKSDLVRLQYKCCLNRKISFPVILTIPLGSLVGTYVDKGIIFQSSTSFPAFARCKHELSSKDV